MKIIHNLKMGTLREIGNVLRGSPEHSILSIIVDF